MRQHIKNKNNNIKCVARLSKNMSGLQKNRKERNEIGKLEWNVICEREKIYSLFIDHRCPNWKRRYRKNICNLGTFLVIFFIEEVI